MDPEEVFPIRAGRNRVMLSGPPRFRSEPENKGPQRKPAGKQGAERKSGKVAAVLQQKSMNASCSSDASSDSTSSSIRASSSSSSATGGMRRSNGVVVKRRECRLRIDKDEEGRCGNAAAEESGGGSQLVGEVECANQSKKRCPWVTPTTEPSYAAFHDEEWGVPVHDDRKLFELLSLCGALAELAWPAILDKRQMFREIFLDFDPVVVSKLNEKKFVMAGSPAHSLLSEQKLRSILENARQICKVRAEFGSFDKYIWNFVNQKATINSFRYSRQVPVKTSKAEVISKDLVRRGFRCIGPTVIYSFMQAAGLTNDHLISCYRHHECSIAEAKETADNHIFKSKTGKKEPEQAFVDIEMP
ncbi:Probable GMP synthase [glutamine-hydrolyzing] [Linum grandiflorum]